MAVTAEVVEAGPVQVTRNVLNNGVIVPDIFTPKPQYKIEPNAYHGFTRIENPDGWIIYVLPDQKP